MCVAHLVEDPPYSNYWIDNFFELRKFSSLTLFLDFGTVILSNAKCPKSQHYIPGKGLLSSENISCLYHKNLYS